MSPLPLPDPYVGGDMARDLTDLNDVEFREEMQKRFDMLQRNQDKIAQQFPLQPEYLPGRGGVLIAENGGTEVGSATQANGSSGTYQDSTGEELGVTLSTVTDSDEYWYVQHQCIWLISAVINAPRLDSYISLAVDDLDGINKGPTSIINWSGNVLQWQTTTQHGVFHIGPDVSIGVEAEWSLSASGGASYWHGDTYHRLWAYRVG